ncbi:hypothetical protein E2986_11471 [Frieseomelitta varia]|uniref:Uncharacterized protein n=1 Tax=Frieseomelitta varia TaxID=561572 RepID=A0A833RS78_9HYME|nr:hypothetical protein E2986_11471 [Frieseomelitta varia]
MINQVKICDDTDAYCMQEGFHHNSKLSTQVHILWAGSYAIIIITIVTLLFEERLKELILDRNGIKELPHELVQLNNLRNISLAGNCLSSLQPFFNMRALALTDVLTKTDHSKGCKDDKNNQNLYKVNLRNNQLKGNIILGNYGVGILIMINI